MPRRKKLENEKSIVLRDAERERQNVYHQTSKPLPPIRYHNVVRPEYYIPSAFYEHVFSDERVGKKARTETTIEPLAEHHVPDVPSDFPSSDLFKSIHYATSSYYTGHEMMEYKPPRDKPRPGPKPKNSAHEKPSNEKIAMRQRMDASALVALGIFMQEYVNYHVERQFPENNILDLKNSNKNTDGKTK